MNDDPTRIMRNDDRDPHGDDGQYTPEDKQKHLRYLLIGLVAVIIGLVIAVFVISGGDSEDPVPTGTTDVPAVTGTTGVVPVVPTGPTGPTGDTAVTGDTGTTSDSGGVTPPPAPAPEPDPTPPDSGGITPDGGSGSPDPGGSSGGISP